MNYPQSPHAFPGQPGPYPPAPSVRRTGSVPAILSGSASIVGGMGAALYLLGAVNGRRAVDRLRDDSIDLDWDHRILEYRLDIALGALLLVLLGIGGALLLARQSSGRTMVITGSGLAALLFITEAAAETTGFLIVIDLAIALAATAVLVLALLPTTGRWVDHSAPIGRRHPERSA